MGVETEVVEKPDDDEADMQQGFANVRAADEAPPTATTVAEEPPVVEKAPDKPTEELKPVETPPDPWAGVPQVVREALQNISSALPRFEQELKTTAGRVGAVQSALDAAKAASSKGAEAPSAAQITAAVPSSAKWTQLREDFPQWAEAMEERLAEEQQALAKKFTPQAPIDLDAVRKQVRDEMQPLIDQTAQAAREAAKLDLKHDGWEHTVATAEFKAWHDKQPADYRELVNSPFAKDADKLLTAYSDFQKLQLDAAKKRERLAAAAPVPGVSTGGPTVMSEDDEMQLGFNNIAKRRS